MITPLDVFLEKRDFKKAVATYKGDDPTVVLTMMYYLKNIKKDKNVVLSIKEDNGEYICQAYYKK